MHKNMNLLALKIDSNRNNRIYGIFLIDIH